MHAQLKAITSVQLLLNATPNLVRGAYDSVDHYLYVQMQLLRLDFTAALHDGIRQLREQRHLSVAVACNSGSGATPPLLSLVSNDTFWVYPSKDIKLASEMRQRNLITRFVVRLTDDEVAWLRKVDGHAAKAAEKAKLAEKAKQAERDVGTAAKQKQKKNGNDSDSDSEDDAEELEPKKPFMNGSLLLFVSNLQLDDLVIAVVVRQDIERKQVGY